MGLVFILAALTVGAGPAAADAVADAVPIWAKAFGTAGTSAITATATDTDRNIIIGGYFSSDTLVLGPGPGGTLQRVSPVGTTDMVVAKFDPNGDLIWARNYGGAALAGARVTGLALTVVGHVYFTGYYQSTTMGAQLDIGGTTQAVYGIGPTESSMIVAKLNADGTTAWAIPVGGIGAHAEGAGITVDDSGNPIVVGHFKDADITVGLTSLVRGGSARSMLVAKLGALNGTTVWAQGSSGTGTTALPRSVGVAPSGNIYVIAALGGGDVEFGMSGLTLSTNAVSDLRVIRFSDSIGTLNRSGRLGGANVAADSLSPTMFFDSSNNVYFAGHFSGGNLTVGTFTNMQTLTWAGASAGNADMFVAKFNTLLDPVWAKNWGAAGASTMAAGLIKDFNDNIRVVGTSQTASLTIGTSLPAKGVQDIVLASLATDDGEVLSAGRYGSAGATLQPAALAGGGTMHAIVGGNFSGAAATIGATTLSLGGSSTMFVADFTPGFPLALTIEGVGTVTSTPARMSCTASCSGYFDQDATVTLTASGATLVSWGGDCGGTANSVTVTMSVARACTANFVAPAGGGGPAPVPTPSPAVPGPPPSFVNVSNAPPAVINADTTGAGQGRLSLASAFTNPSGLIFTASQVSGAALPSWLIFNPSTVSFDYNVPLPANLPIQPSADIPAEATARTARAGRNVVNTIYPLAVLVQRIPVSLTAAGAGQTYTAAINMDFYAPRAPVAMTAISYSLDGQSGNAASARPALSWDGGQVVFETLATNISPSTVGYRSIARYHGLSGQRDLLSQTAIPGGGVANGADGNSNNPAVSSAGNYAAFSSVAPGVSATPNNRLRQVYRTSLVYPRVSLNEGATPAAVMMSTTAAGVAADAAADKPAMSERGDFVAFESAAGNLGTNPDRLSQIWRKDAGTGAMILVSSTAGGVAGNGDSRNVSLSWDGRYAVFESTSTNLAPGIAAGRHVYLKDLGDTKWINVLSTVAGSGDARIDGRGGSVVYVAPVGGTSQIMRYDIAAATTTLVSVTPSGVAANGDSSQPAVSADGRFVVFRSTATDLVPGIAGNGQAQVWVRDVMRGVTALVTQTEGGAAGNGPSSDPAISGDGAAIALASQARDLVNGTPLPGQIHLAANPLVLPGRTAYWQATGGGNLSWGIERWGDKALIAGLAYNVGGGAAVWAAGNCQFTGLTCQGSVSQWSGQGATATPIGPISLTFSADGRTGSVTLGNTAAQPLAPHAIGGARSTGFAGLPQSGFWGVTGNAAGVTSLFIDTDTQAGADGGALQATHVTLFGYDAAGQAQWYAAEGRLAPDLSFTGQLQLYSGGSSWVQGSSGAAASASPVGAVRLTFQAGDRATLQLPDGRTVAISRWRF